MSFFKKLFGKSGEAKTQEDKLPWIEPSENRWGLLLLDLRPVTLNMLSSSTDPQMAANAASYGSEDGTTFKDQLPYDSTITEAGFSFPTDGALAPGVLFLPQAMEHKWAIYYHDNKIIFVRSWLRKVHVVASTEQTGNNLKVVSIQGRFSEKETPEFTKQVLKYILKSHVLGEVIPAPLPSELMQSPNEAALWAFSAFGNMAHFGSFSKEYDIAIMPSQPLRTHSLLHICVAKGEVEKIEDHYKAGISLDILAADGLAPLHWSVAAESIEPMARLLELGANPDVRSSEGATPLMNAVQSNKIEHLNLLIRADADIDAVDNRGFTALHRAAEMGHIEIVAILLDMKADKSISSNGHTALSFAEQRGHKEVIELLRNNSY